MYLLCKRVLLHYTSTVSEDGDSRPERLIMVTNFFEELRQVVPD